MPSSAEPEGRIYTHPTLRTENHERLLLRLEQIRNRRLIAALEYKRDVDIKRAKQHDKLSDQYEKLSDTIRRKFNKLDEELIAMDKQVAKLISIGHQMQLLEDIE